MLHANLIMPMGKLCPSLCQFRRTQ